jgi:hypothetical protein
MTYLTRKRNLLKHIKGVDKMLEMQVVPPDNIDKTEQTAYNAAVFNFARSIFSQISDALIQQNFNEFAYIYESRQACDACMSIQMCNELACTDGYIPVPEFEPKGRVKVGMAPCKFNPQGAGPKVWKSRFKVTVDGKAG